MLKAAKKNFLSAAKRVGVFDVFSRSGFRNERLLILGYHGIALEDEHQWNPSLFMSEEFLRRRFELIKENGCQVLPLSEALSRLASRTLPDRAVVLTFDDGGYNFYSKALPLLKEFDFPATVYLTTYYSVFNQPVFPVAGGYLLWAARDKRLNLDTLIGSGGEVDLAVGEERRRAHCQVIAFADRADLTAEEKDTLLSKISNQLSIDYEDFCRQRRMSLMNTDEVAAIADAGIDVQLHTHRHRVPYEKNLFMKEISENANFIESIANIAPRHLCYPSGKYSSSFFPWMDEAGITSATTCEAALAGASTHRFRLPRLVDTSNLSEIEFEGWLHGISHFLPQRQNALK